MTVTFKRLGKKPFFVVSDEEGEHIGLIDFEGKAKLSLHDGCEANADELCAEIEESEKRIARSHSLFLLSRRDYSSAELFEKLRELPVNATAAQFAVEWLCELGYINDCDFARRVASHYAKGGYGPMRLKNELRRRGFGDEATDAAMFAAEETSDFVTSARALAEKKYGILEDLTYEEKAKVSAFLARRGFTYEQIRSALG